jgi:hypothetical protein
MTRLVMLLVSRLLPLAASCAPTLVPTNAWITRLEDAGLRACRVKLGMSVTELVAECGKPDRIVPWVGHPEAERCLIYATDAVAFDAPPGAPFIAVCTGVQSGQGGFLTPESRPQIVAVFGLRDLPPVEGGKAP